MLYWSNPGFKSSAVDSSDENAHTLATMFASFRSVYDFSSVDEDVNRLHDELKYDISDDHLILACQHRY